MLRNREFKRFCAFYLLLASFLCVLGFIISMASGALCLIASAVFGAAFFVFTRARYRNLARISKQIDVVLHNADRMELGDFEEGELSILHSEITKMMLRIREQNDALMKDRQYLADSLADIAHQLRTPLTSANLILSFLAKEPDGTEDYIRELEELLVRMDWLITALLKISRLEAGVATFRNEPVNVRELAASALRPLTIPMELRNMDLRINVPDETCLHGDLGWLSEAVQNILKNCMESAGENGRIEISCADNPLFTELTIRDSGAGFNQKDLPHLFDRFYRGENVGTTGYGIGLALSRMIVTRQNGTITAKNHPDGGAVFSLRFQKVTDVSKVTKSSLESHRGVI